MTTDDIIKLAREAGIDRERPYLPVEYREPWNSCTDVELERFAHLIRAAALEEAAVCAWSQGMDLHLRVHDSREVGSKCAAAIRQLKETK